MRPALVRSVLRPLSPLLLVAGLVSAVGIGMIQEAAAAPATTSSTLALPDPAPGHAPTLMQVATPTATPAVTPTPTPAPTRTPTPPPTRRELPDSGSFTAVLALSGVTAIQVGAGLMLLASRRRRRPEPPPLGDDFFFRP